MEVATLKENGLQYQPDIVLILFVGNGLDLPNFIREPVSFFAPKSFLVDWMRQKAPDHCADKARCGSKVH